MAALLTWLGTTSAGSMVVSLFNNSLQLFNTFFGAKNTNDEKNSAEAKQIANILDESEKIVTNMHNPSLSGEYIEKYRKDIAD